MLQSKTVLLANNQESRYLAYLNELTGYFCPADMGVVSLIVFGSAATGGFADANSDVDVLLVLEDNTPKKYRKILLQYITRLEIKHGFVREVNGPFEKIRQTVLNLMGLQLSHFVCYKKDFIKGDYATIFCIPLLLRFMAPAGKIAFANLLQSGIIFWGKDLLEQVRLTPVRRRHLIMSLVSVLGISFAAFIIYPFSGMATRMSMGALKAVIHNCCFCYGLGNANLNDKTTFLISKFPQQKLLQDFLVLRNEYKNSFRFVKGVFGISCKLYLNTLKEVSFPVKFW